MVDELRAQFLPKFVDETRARVRRAMSMIPPIGTGDAESAESIAAMMESITGEALLIGLPGVALLGRAAAAAARRYLEIHNDAALVACARTLRTLNRAVEELALPSAEAATASVSAAESGEFSQTRVLIVDDSPLNAALMREVLMNQGFDANAVKDDFDLVMQKLKELRPHVLLVDWLMPRCDTRTLCRHIRSRPEFAPLRILLITSVPQQEASRLAASMGIEGALSKEQGISAVVDCVRAALKEPR